MNTVEKYIKYTMILLIIVLLVLGIFITRDYFSLRKAEIINARELQLSALVKGHHPLTANDVAVIRPWMTFYYINGLFNVPANYLQQNLSISDPAYPQISLSGYAKHQHMSPVIIMNEVEGSLHNYLSATSTY